MSKLAIIPMLLLALGGEHERGLQLYREGKFAEAAVAFRAAIAQDGDSAELQWNLALACFAAGELDAAEVAAEKYAALAKDARADLHLGMLGAVRHAQAKAGTAEALAPAASAPSDEATPADPLPKLEQALAKATEAADYYERAAAVQAAPELLRNLERSQRLQQALTARIDELKKEREKQQSEDKEKDPQQKDQGDKSEKDKADDKKPDDKKDDEKKDDKGEKKPDEKSEQQKKEDKPGEQEQGDEPKDEKKPPDGKSEQQQSSGGEQQEQPPEPKGDGGKEQQPAKDEKGGRQSEAGDSGKDGADAPPVGVDGKDGKSATGEPKPAKELTPEQAQQLAERLDQLDKRLRAARARAKSGRPPVERDW